MRHARVPIGELMRDAWLRCMGRALDEQGVTGELRGVSGRALCGGRGLHAQHAGVTEFGFANSNPDVVRGERIGVVFRKKKLAFEFELCVRRNEERQRVRVRVLQ